MAVHKHIKSRHEYYTSARQKMFTASAKILLFFRFIKFVIIN